MANIIKRQIWFLTLTSAIMLSLPFLFPRFALASLVAFIPLFEAERIAKDCHVKFFFLQYFICFLLWNVITTYWIWFATPAGAVAAIVLNALQMALIFRLFRWFRKRSDGILPYFGFVVVWLSWEHLYYTWQISWPWLTLGNSFAGNVDLVQWYSFTGTLGGSLWILLTNSLLYLTLKAYGHKSDRRKHLLVSACIAYALPLACTLGFYVKEGLDEVNMEHREVVVLQPNIDPYNTKFTVSQEIQNDILFDLARKAITPNTFLVVAPETFFNPTKAGGKLYEDMPRNNETAKLFSNFATENNLNIIYGAVTQLTTVSDRQPNQYSKLAGYNAWYNIYNSAVFNNTKGDFHFYHKSKLVILAESVPMINGKPIFESLGIDLGGGIGHFTPQNRRTVFKTTDGVMIGSAICYESVFGDFCREYIKNGANLLTVITNDGWWKNTPGHIQHLNYARLRAIETRRAIARSANTGISAIIDTRGHLVNETSWWEEGYIRGEIALNKEITFFVRYGDYIGRFATWLAVYAILRAILSLFFKKRDM